LETDLAYRPTPGRRVCRFLFAQAAGLYLGSVSLLTALLVGLGLAWLRRQHASPAVQAWAAAFLLLPASELAIAFVQRLVGRMVPPRRLPRLDPQAPVPEGARTLVVVPTLLTSVAGVDALIEHVEVLALGNLDPCIHFAILGDFADAPERD